MAQQLQQPVGEIYYIVVLLLLSYVMSSAPRYIHHLKRESESAAPMPTAPEIQWHKLLHAYTLRPYVQAWDAFTSSGEKMILATMEKGK